VLAVEVEQGTRLVRDEDGAAETAARCCRSASGADASLTRVATMQRWIFTTEFHGVGGLGGEREDGLEDADHRKKNRELKGGLTMRK
jgi:hypothetical protein